MIAELRTISKVYPLAGNLSGNRVLNELSLEIPGNTSIAITGPSGSGKSTLLQILGTLDTPTSGEVWLDGKPAPLPGDPALAELRNRYTGFVFQAHYLLPQLSLFENILLPALPLKDETLKREAVARAQELLVQLGLKDMRNSFPTRMSVGECQRGAVIRALVNAPKLLLADEPTGSLDHDNALLLADTLLDLQSKLGFSMVVVTHSAEIAAKMQIHYRLESGKLLPS